MKTDIFSGEPIYLYYISLKEGNYIYNIIGDKLLLNFGAKFQC